MLLPCSAVLCSGKPRVRVRATDALGWVRGSSAMRQCWAGRLRASRQRRPPRRTMRSSCGPCRRAALHALAHTPCATSRLQFVPHNAHALPTIVVSPNRIVLGVPAGLCDKTSAFHCCPPPPCCGGCEHPQMSSDAPHIWRPPRSFACVGCDCLAVWQARPEAALVGCWGTTHDPEHVVQRRLPSWTCPLEHVRHAVTGSPAHVRSMARATE